jgi:hypothetical protein
MRRKILTSLMVLIGFSSFAAEQPLSLAGTWRFQLDRADVGVAERWAERTLPERVKLPGDLSEQGIGDPPSLATKWIGGIQKSDWHLQPELSRYSTPENFKFPFWLTPERHYIGAAWYQREIAIPPAWANQRVVLTLERPHWETRVWVDGRLMGTNNALGTPHEYDLGQLQPGKHKLTIRVDNRMIVDVGENSHSVSDHTQGNWNGIVGKIELRATPLVWIEDLRVEPNVAKKSAVVKGKLGNASGNSGKGTIEFKLALAANRSVSTEVVWNNSGGSFETEISLGDDAPLWDEFNPAVYELIAELKIETADAKPAPKHTFKTVFGLREIGTQGTQFIINGRKAFFRGTLECAIFPRTGHPPTDLESWQRIMKVSRAHGLNMIRFHSWCPPEAAFTAADEAGVYLQVECSSWANQSTTIGDGKPVDAWVYQEADRILKHYGNHPSFVLMLYGNEPGGAKQREYLEKWVTTYKAKDSRRLYSSGAGWPQIPANDFHLPPDPRIQRWGDGLKSRINAQPPETTTDYRDYIQKRSVPVISHEIGQWCVYPNFDEMRKYTGYLKARNFEIFRASLNANHLSDQAKQFLRASGKLQALCYKEDIEAALRTPGMGGFQLLDLHDFPGQGTALVGVLDPFWEEKGYISPEEYSRFCNATVPLARLSKRVFTSDEKLEADLEVAHFGLRPLPAEIKWKLVAANGKIIADGGLPARTIPVDNAIALGRISVPLAAAAAPQQCKLVVAIEETAAAQKSGQPARYENDWDVWVYPPKVNAEAAAEIAIAEELNSETLAKLEAGGKVLLLVPPARVKNLETNQVALGFSSIFWNTAWTHRQAPTTLGILCDPKHPMFAEFPTDFHSNWQWWYLIRRAAPLILDGLPAKLRPTVQVIDDWVTNHRLALLFEASVARGKLMVCSVDLKNELEADPVRRQFRHSLLRYMEGKQFKPQVKLTPDQIRGLIKPFARVKGLEVESISADSEETGYEASNVLDLDANSIWHTAWTPEIKKHPHELKIALKSARTFRGVTLLPRQDGHRNGWIKDYACYVSAEGTNWGEPVAKGTFAADAKLKTVQFARPVTARFIRFVALSGFGADGFSSLAEFSLVEEGATNGMTDERGVPIRQVRGGIFETNKSGVIPVTVDGHSDGLRFDGIGAVSSGGSTRLLVDYPEPQRSQVLDYLFKPNYGAALQILKVEIGADTDATCGAEPSHERVRGVVQIDRGYEWWLMKEAKARNPKIKLAGLAWGAPGWLKGGFWSDDNIRYTIGWLHCARSNGLTIDYLGGGNERGWEADYYIKLAAALKQNGYGHIKVVATDDHNPPNYWSVATTMKKNSAFAAAVDVVGQHDVCGWRTPQRHCSVNTDALELGKPLWDSENSTQDYRVGIEPLTRVMTRHNLDAGVTANLNWALIASMYGSFPCGGTGIMLADRPWSGFFDVGKIVWIDAHVTQFTEPGWRYLDSACGYTRGNASFTTLRAPTSGDYTMVIETVDLAEPETLEVDVTGGLSSGPVQLWATELSSTDRAKDFVHVGAIQPKNGRYQIKIEPGRLYTVSTLTGQYKGDAQPPVGSSVQMALPYEENFERTSVGGLARYFSDVHGGFEVALAGGGRSGRVYRQVVPQEPILWHRAKMPPTTIFGDPRWWGDYELSADVLLEGPGYVELLGRIESQQHNVAGYHFQISDTGAWSLYTQDVNGADRVLASGTNQPIGLNRWQRLALRFRGDEITALLNGAALKTIRDDSHAMGQVGLRVSPWQHAQFDNVKIVPTAEWPELIAHSELNVSATSEHAENDHGMIHIARNAIDDRVETTWRSEYSPAAPLPQSITLDLGRERSVKGVICRPAIAGGDNAGGRITEYNAYVSANGTEFEKVASGKWPANLAAKLAEWSERTARFVRLEATASSSRAGVAVSEIEIIAGGSNGSEHSATHPGSATN